MQKPLRFLAERTRGYWVNLGNGPSWPAKALTISRNRLRATVSGDGCCGNHGEPGC